MKSFRMLKPDEIECRVSQCSERGVSIVLYKTARTDADLLDETVGAKNWENDFKLVDGVLYGGIGVDYDGTGLIWKWDAGTESNTDADKGRASDAFKRAGFKHGIGRELYSAPFIWVAAAQCKRLKRNDKTGKYQCSDRFDVLNIEYDKSERISAITLALDGKIVYRWVRSDKNAPDTHDDLIFTCAECGCEITSATYDGKAYAPSLIAEQTTKKCGRALCWNCYMKRQFGDRARTSDV